MREDQVVSDPTIIDRANHNHKVEQHDAKNKWLDDALASLDRVTSNHNPQEKLLRQQRQREILAHFYEDTDGLEVITETVTRYPTEKLLGNDYGALFKGKIFEGLALASLGERKNAYIETEKFLLEILRTPMLLKPLFEGIIPGPILEKITTKSHIYLDTHDICTAAEPDFNLLVERINSTILSDPDFSSSEKTKILAYLSYVEIVRKYSQRGETKKNNDGIALEIVENPETRTQTVRITGLIEAKGYSDFRSANISAVIDQRQRAPEELYELVTAMQPFLEFFLEELGLIDVIPTNIECAKPEDLSYTLIIGEGTHHTEELEKALQKTNTTKLKSIPFTPQEIWELANFFVN